MTYDLRNTTAVYFEGKQYFAEGAWVASEFIRNGKAIIREVSSLRIRAAVLLLVEEKLEEKATALLIELAKEEQVAQAKALRPSFETPAEFAKSTDPVVCTLRNAEGFAVAEARGALQADACINALVRAVSGLSVDNASDLVSDVLRNGEAQKAASKYAAIRLWGERLGSFDYYITAVQHEAVATGAPLDALYERNGEWTCVSDLAPEHDFRKAYAKRLEKLGLDTALATVVAPTVPQARAEFAAQAAGAAEAGVTVTVEYLNGDQRFVMRATQAGTGYVLMHSLSVSCTDDERLHAHVHGFVGNVHNDRKADEKAQALAMALPHIQACADHDRAAMARNNAMGMHGSAAEVQKQLDSRRAAITWIESLLP